MLIVRIDEELFIPEIPIALFDNEVRFNKEVTRALHNYNVANIIINDISIMVSPIRA